MKRRENHTEDSIKELIESRTQEMKEIISWLDEWKDSEYMSKILLSQVRRIRLNIKLLELKLKVMKLFNE